jgi:sulfatase maturation enzyme AslB (radical SAM superfamily)
MVCTKKGNLVSQSWNKSIGNKITSPMMFTKKKQKQKQRRIRKDMRTYLDQRCKRKKLLSCLIGGCESPNITVLRAL